MFADILVPPEWAKIHGADWTEIATELRGQFDEMGVESMVDTLDNLLDKHDDRDLGNPFPYLHPENQ
jgi:hypothetical protein